MQKLPTPTPFFWKELQLLNNEVITTKTLLKPAWSYLEARAKAGRRQSEG